MALFQLIDPAGGPAPPGPWQARPSAPEGRSFGLGAGVEATAPVWRVNLSADPLAAATDLHAAETSLTAQEHALTTATARMGALAATGEAASFSTRELPAPERALLTLVGELRGERASSFSTRGAEDKEDLAAVNERFQAFVSQVRDAVANLAVVETLVEGTLVARTTVSWTGDLRLVLRAARGTGYAALHQRSLGLALRSRAALLRTFGTVMRGASIVMVMVSSPVGVVTAMPAAWRFVDQLLSDVRSGGATNGQ